MPYCMYLRKSRVDIEAEARGEGETLARHEAVLLGLAKAHGRAITEIYREIVSGDTIAERPVMQRLLSEVQAGVWDGVYVMDIDRLARGDTIDQGIVAQAFRLSGTHIITPLKTYDPTNEFDEEYFEFGLFMSRREYKMITRRQQRGRVAAVSEGKWPWNKAPYGYTRVKLSDRKGWTLEVDPERAEVVKNIFAWYTSGCPDPEGGTSPLGVPRIARRLNELGVASPSGRDWTNSAVKEILRNPVYAGWVWHGHRAVVKKVENGVVKKCRPRAEAEKITLVRGIHQPIIAQETFDAAARRLAENPSRPGPKSMPTKNPLSGLVYCGVCGRSMVRRPYSHRPDTLMCAYTSCSNVSSDLPAVESALISALRDWLRHLETDVEQHSVAEEIAALKKTREGLEKDVDMVGRQEKRAYELVEQGVYSSQVFIERMRELSGRRADLLKKIENVDAEIAKFENLGELRARLAPEVRRVLDAYREAESAEEKNSLLKTVLHRADYFKTKNLRWSSDDDMRLVIYPKIPPSLIDNFATSKNSATLR